MTAESPDEIELRFRLREIDRLNARIAALEAIIAQLLKNATQVRESGDARTGILQQRVDELELAEGFGAQQE